MPPLFPIGLVLVAFAIVVSMLLGRSAASAQRRARDLARGTLAETGLSLDGDPIGAFTLRGRVSAVDVVLESSAIERIPGPSGESSVVCMARVALPIADMIVCRVSDIDRTMGPLPSAERPRTGHAAFDARYAVFVTAAHTHFRGAEPAVAGAWAAPATLDRLMDLELEWLRVRDGKAEIALSRLGADDAARGLAVAANVVRASRGEPLVDIPSGAVAERPRLLDHSLVVWWAVAGTFGLFGGFIASFFEPLRTIDQEAVCGPGATLLHTESDSDGGTSHDFHCSNNQDSILILLHVLSCMLIVGGLVATILLLRAAIGRRPTV